MRRLTQKQKYILVGVFIFAILLLIILDRREHYSDIQFKIPPFGNDGGNGNNGNNGGNGGNGGNGNNGGNGGNGGFKDDFILDFSKDGTNIDKLKKEFTTKSYSGITKDGKCSNNPKPWSGELGEYDPTCGNVAYIDEFDDTTSSEKLISIEGKHLQLKLGKPTHRKTTDEILSYLNQNTSDTNKNVFPSIRLTSTKSFKNDKQHVFVLKAKLPYGRSLWPAWWLTGTDSGDQSTLNTKWPTNGEIDIIELVNEQNQFKNVLHMCKKCNSRWKKGLNDKWGKSKDCEGEFNSGCFEGTETPLKDPSGVFACWWNPETKDATIDDNKVTILGSIQFYYWEYDKGDFDGGPMSSNPNPTTWDKDMMAGVEYWKTKGEGGSDDKTADCDKATCQFNDMKMIFNTTVCGDWAGNIFDPDDAGDNSVKKCLDYINTSDGSTAIQKQKWDISYIAAFSKSFG